MREKVQSLGEEEGLLLLLWGQCTSGYLSFALFTESIPNSLPETQLWYVDDYVRVRPSTDDYN